MFGNKYKQDRPPCRFVEQVSSNVESLTKSLDTTTAKVESIERRLHDGNLKFEKNDGKMDRLEEKVSSLTDTVNKIDLKTDELIQKPAKKWESTSNNVLQYIIIGILGFILVKMGLPI